MILDLPATIDNRDRLRANGRGFGAMSSIDLDAVLAPVSGSEPSGPDLVYDAAFMALESAAQGKPEHQMGTTVVPGEDADWKAVQRQSTALLPKTRDLRIAIYLLKALIRTSGWKGLSEGLALIRGLVEQYWDKGLHPRPDGNDDPIRLNALMELESPDVLAALRAIPLCVSQVLGPLTMKQVEGVLSGGDAGPETLNMATIEGMLSESPLDSLQAIQAALGSSSEAIGAIESATSSSLEQVGAVMRSAGKIVGDAVARQTPGTAAQDDASGDARANGTGPSYAGGQLKGEISSRDDVLKALDKICAYYAKYEPSSPIPMFMERCKRLVVMSFVDIVNELVPDAAKQVDLLRGVRE